MIRKERLRLSKCDVRRNNRELRLIKRIGELFDILFGKHLPEPCHQGFIVRHNKNSFRSKKKMDCQLPSDVPCKVLIMNCRNIPIVSLTSEMQSLTNMSVMTRNIARAMRVYQISF